MEKHIRIEFGNGAVWGIPLHVIADDRAKYYAERDKDTTYQKEYDFVMNDDYEGLDWYQNNMNWEDVEKHAYEIKPPRPFLPGEHLDDDRTYYEVVLK